MNTQIKARRIARNVALTLVVAVGLVAGTTGLARAQASKRTFFYDRDTRMAATGVLWPDGTHGTLRSYPANSFGDWSDIVGGHDECCYAGMQDLFFYNRNTGAAAMGYIDELGNFQNTRDFPAGSFSKWTKIARVRHYLFFYNENTGAAAISRVGGGSPTPTGFYQYRLGFPAGSFGLNWTHVVGKEDKLVSERVNENETASRGIHCTPDSVSAGSAVSCGSVTGEPGIEIC